MPGLRKRNVPFLPHVPAIRFTPCRNAGTLIASERDTVDPPASGNTVDGLAADGSRKPAGRPAAKGWTWGADAARPESSTDLTSLNEEANPTP